MYIVRGYGTNTYDTIWCEHVIEHVLFKCQIWLIVPAMPIDTQDPEQNNLQSWLVM